MKQEDRHVCRPGGKRVDWRKDRPSWGDPGELTKIAGENRWGRVKLLHNCCGEREVALEAFGGDEAETRRCWLTDLENPWADYPHELPPRGYPVLRPWPMKGSRPFPGRQEQKA